jgi:hypothetical protein
MSKQSKNESTPMMYETYFRKYFRTVLERRKLKEENFVDCELLSKFQRVFLHAFLHEHVRDVRHSRTVPVLVIVPHVQLYSGVERRQGRS